jgi:hypothetical protein
VAGLVVARFLHFLHFDFDCEWRRKPASVGNRTYRRRVRLAERERRTEEAGNTADFYREAPWLILFPGAAISVAVFAVNFLGDSSRPRL